VNYPRDHHYVPQFLLSRWCQSNGKLTVYSRAQGRVITSELHPRSTAFERDLYAFKMGPQDRRQAIETDFMSKRIDSPAAPIVQKIVDGKLASLTADERSDFTRFILSLRARHPDAVNLAKVEGEQTLRKELERAPEEYLSAKDASSPPTFVEWVEKNAESVIPNFGVSLVPSVIADDTIGRRIFGMPWSTYDARHSNTDLIIGDRPCLLEGDAVAADFFMALPLSPTIVFLISSRPVSIARLRNVKPTEFVKRLNKSSVVYASKRVYSTGGHHTSLVAKYLGN
jgi:Protein of unknown function (DUF4238)